MLYGYLWILKREFMLKTGGNSINAAKGAMTKYKVTNAKGKEIYSDIALHPGDILMDELEARDISKSVFARKLGIKPGHLSELLHAKRNVSAATALKLEKLLGIPAEYWMRVQVYYDLFIERNKQQDAA